MAETPDLKGIAQWCEVSEVQQVETQCVTPGRKQNHATGQGKRR